MRVVQYSPPKPAEVTIPLSSPVFHLSGTNFMGGIKHWYPIHYPPQLTVQVTTVPLQPPSRYAVEAKWDEWLAPSPDARPSVGWMDKSVLQISQNFDVELLWCHYSLHIGEGRAKRGCDPNQGPVNRDQHPFLVGAQPSCSLWNSHNQWKPQLSSLTKVNQHLPI